MLPRIFLLNTPMQEWKILQGSCIHACRRRQEDRWNVRYTHIYASLQMHTGSARTGRKAKVHRLDGSHGRCQCSSSCLCSHGAGLSSCRQAGAGRRGSRLRLWRRLYRARWWQLLHGSRIPCLLQGLRHSRRCTFSLQVAKPRVLHAHLNLAIPATMGCCRWMPIWRKLRSFCDRQKGQHGATRLGFGGLSECDPEKSPLRRLELPLDKPCSQ